MLSAGDVFAPIWGEIKMLFRPDMGGLSVEEIVTPFGLWVRNGLIHFGMGATGWFGSVYCGWTSRHLWLLFAAYVALQFAQLTTPPSVALAFFDGIADVAIIIMGYLFAIHLTGHRVT